MLKVPLFFTAEATCRNQPRNRAFHYESGAFWNAFVQVLPESADWKDLVTVVRRRRLAESGGKRSCCIGASHGRINGNKVPFSRVEIPRVRAPLGLSAMPISPCRPLETAVRKGIWADHLQQCGSSPVMSAHDFSFPGCNCFGPGPPDRARMPQ